MPFFLLWPPPHNLLPIVLARGLSCCGRAVLLVGRSWIPRPMVPPFCYDILINPTYPSVSPDPLVIQYRYPIQYIMARVCLACLRSSSHARRRRRILMHILLLPYWCPRRRSVRGDSVYTLCIVIS
ncbi:uncharacterized protein SCHCODRAFT_02022593 [Schizophyllum commune H4-8]|uniref:uncharacterized protein n=1 Tax=Schizophyllum commune (strain H4-8 / FGSC 9210) TaxID=578458 RepID=UPI00216092EB|nr:uncharacterized protein SCHCODRAFT_02022593 [Schizophyllum commune H4-8]KAI5899866.1 hypothetical protein SCHCODRAFT_02022593 [Schizophyllum commune H4-8]